MTQVSRYGHMLKVTVEKMTMHVVARFRVTGSVLQDTIEGEMLGAETTLEIESPDDPARVARVIRNAERGCFVMQALLRPVPITTTTVLNGAPLPASARGTPEGAPHIPVQTFQSSWALCSPCGSSLRSWAARQAS